MFTNTRVCLFDAILIVTKWILVQLLGINFAGINFAYLPVLSKVFRFTFLRCFCSVVRNVCLQMFSVLAQRKLSLVLDRTLAQRKAQQKAKSKTEVAQCVQKLTVVTKDHVQISVMGLWLCKYK